MDNSYFHPSYENFIHVVEFYPCDTFFSSMLSTFVNIVIFIHEIHIHQFVYISMVDCINIIHVIWSICVIHNTSHMSPLSSIPILKFNLIHVAKVHIHVISFPPYHFRFLFLNFKFRDLTTLVIIHKRNSPNGKKSFKMLMTCLIILNLNFYTSKSKSSRMDGWFRAWILASSF
jgi:hypothetical protein